MTKKTLAIVTGSVEASGALLLQEAGAHLGYDARLVLVYEDDAAERINAADTVVFRIAPRTYALYYEIIDSLKPRLKKALRASLAAFDKKETYETLVAAGVPTPKSFSIGHNERLDGYPKIIKILNGSQGKGVGLIHSDEELNAYRDEFKDESEFLVQEFVEESRGSDKRLFVVGDRVLAAMRRISQTEDFRANLHLGGRMEAYAPTETEREYAIKAVKALQLPYAGVDIIDSKDGPLVLEVNSSPGFGVQQVTSIDLPTAVLKHVARADVVIRFANESDVERMYEISLAAHGTGYESMIPEHRKEDFAKRFANTDELRAHFYKRALARIRATDWRAWVAEVDGVVAGYTYAEVLSDEYVYKRGIFVDPDYQGKGVGKALFDVSLKVNKTGIIRLTVIKSNEKARAMYRAHGFVDTDIEEKPFFDAPQVVMQLTLR